MLDGFGVISVDNQMIGRNLSQGENKTVKVSQANQIAIKTSFENIARLRGVGQQRKFMWLPISSVPHTVVVMMKPKGMTCARRAISPGGSFLSHTHDYYYICRGYKINLTIEQMFIPYAFVVPFVFITCIKTRNSKASSCTDLYT